MNTSHNEPQQARTTLVLTFTPDGKVQSVNVQFAQTPGRSILDTATLLQIARDWVLIYNHNEGEIPQEQGRRVYHTCIHGNGPECGTCQN